MDKRTFLKSLGAALVAPLAFAWQAKSKPAQLAGWDSPPESRVWSHRGEFKDPELNAAVPVAVRGIGWTAYYKGKQHGQWIPLEHNSSLLDTVQYFQLLRDSCADCLLKLQAGA